MPAKLASFVVAATGFVLLAMPLHAQREAVPRRAADFRCAGSLAYDSLAASPVTNPGFISYIYFGARIYPKFWVSMAVMNTGNTSALAEVTVFLTVNGVPRRFIAPAVQVDANSFRRVAWDIGKFQERVEIIIEGIVDPDGKVAEVSEVNNRCTRKMILS